MEGLRQSPLKTLKRERLEDVSIKDELALTKKIKLDSGCDCSSNKNGLRGQLTAGYQ